MKREEFIQEAALRLISVKPDLQMCEIAELAVSLACCLYDQEFKEPEVLEAFPDGEPIRTIVEEIDRMDEEEKRRQMKEAGERGLGWRFQKSGYAIKVAGICSRRDIKTVKDLMDFGRVRFANERNVGSRCVEVIDRALRNLYNIKGW